jgi:hypothetical protein
MEKAREAHPKHISPRPHLDVLLGGVLSKVPNSDEKFVRNDSKNGPNNAVFSVEFGCLELGLHLLQFLLGCCWSLGV